MFTKIMLFSLAVIGLLAHLGVLKATWDLNSLAGYMTAILCLLTIIILDKLDGKK